MKSPAVYKVLREIVGPWAKSAGFKRGGGGMLSYERPVPGGAGFQTFWFQCSQDGWDAHAGSKFTLGFQRAGEPGPGRGGRSWRFARLLTPEERERVRFVQNLVITKLQPPPPDHWTHALDAGPKRWYFAQFDPIVSPYAENEDVWLRYSDEEDICRWGEFLLPRLPALLEKSGSDGQG
jgi:hypothetical protein